MKINVAAAIAALILGVAAPVTSASAFDYGAPYERTLPDARYDGLTTGSIDLHEGPSSYGCAASSAAEGNANQQNREVKQYGQTSGGTRC